ncbi:MAG: hypothetical protein QF441_00195 [Bacteriovoracaceae bacterium]|jgi:hypothetical protein|nr:hypothetical protein [Bacteriovoracaceae bacterium]
MQYIKYLLTLFSISIQAEVAQLQTKQDISKIRYISSDGKFTYYQKNSGELQLSTNYNFTTLLKKPKLTQYNLFTSPKESVLIIEAIEQYYSNQGLRKNNTVYTSAVGEQEKVEKIGNGRSPKLHLDDNWISFYQPQKGNIVFHNLSAKIPSKKITLTNKINPYFIPTVGMITPNDIIYTDLNLKGLSALIQYSFIEKKFSTIYKAKSPGTKIEFCRYQNKLIVGEFPHSGVESKSSIRVIPLFKNKNYQNQSVIYTNGLNDIGNMVCKKNKVFFIRTNEYHPQINKGDTDIYSLDIESKKIKRQTNFKNVTQIIPMGNLILTVEKGKYYIVEGNQKLINDQIKEDN